MNTNPTNRKAVEDLAVGDHISDAAGVHKVEHRLPFRNGDRQPSIALTLTPLGNGQPWVARHAEGFHLNLATDDEVQEFHDASRRLALAMALRQLARDIVDKRLPLPSFTLHIGGVVESRRELERWADYLDGKVQMGGTGDDIPVIRVTKDVPGGPSLAIGMQSAAEPEPAPLKVDAAIAAAKALEPKDTGKTAECGCHIFQNPLVDDPEVIHDTACQDWYFTFGSGHVHPDSPDINPEGGAALADRYVVIRGTYGTARTVMLRFFGRVWCDQYGSAERAGVERFGLTALTRCHWPTPVADAATPTQQAGE